MPERSTLLLALLLLFAAWSTSLKAEQPTWVSEGPQGRQVHLYFFWSMKCPHCQKALPVVQDFEVDHPWLTLHSIEISRNSDHARRYADMAASLGEEARVVPGFFVCGQLLTGFDTAEGRGREVLDLARTCHEEGLAAVKPPDTTHLPVLGDVDPQTLSLPLYTVVLAGLDAFNPCAFFVLLFLLSLLVHTRNRRRMLLIGSVFVAVSGLVYFVFMAAWLNLFLVIRYVPWVTGVAGVLALVIGALNTKDFFALGQGPSLSMSDNARSRLFQRMRGLLSAERLPVMLTGTVFLSVAANSYELLCTAGFPMVYTRLLTLHELSGSQHYAYLAMYNLIYVLPLLVIVLLFTATLGRHKLSEQGGRSLKLLSGLMMSGMGLVLLIAPEALSRPSTGAGLLLTVVALTWALSRAKRLNRRPERPEKEKRHG